MEGKEYYRFLLNRYSNGLATVAEKEELFSELAKMRDQPDWEELVQEHMGAYGSKEYDEARWEGVIQKILDARPKTNVRQISPWLKFAAAAMVMLLLGAGAYLIVNKTKTATPEIPVAKNPVPQDIAPGGDRATLTLADGTRIILDSAADGSLTNQGGIRVIKAGGQLSYAPAESTNEVLYNTVTTPKGGQYQLVLADGTKVWLNAESSLRFPMAFAGKERMVELTGEGYFEVQSLKDEVRGGLIPFSVAVNGAVIEVLGTHFNINSYDDEPAMKTTLLEGKVRVRKGSSYLNLHPGQQAVITKGSENIRVTNNVDLDAVMAWKNGLIYFEGADVAEIMRQISRWYNVEAGYTGNPQTAHLTGKVSRQLKLSQVIKVLETSGIDIKMDGNKMIATPKP